jgi:hypothetical protein
MLRTTANLPRRVVDEAFCSLSNTDTSTFAACGFVDVAFGLSSTWAIEIAAAANPGHGAARALISSRTAATTLLSAFTQVGALFIGSDTRCVLCVLPVSDPGNSPTASRANRRRSRRASEAARLHRSERQPLL